MHSRWNLWKALPDAILIVDPQAGSVLDANPLFLRIADATIDAVVGRPFSDLLPDIDLAALDSAAAPRAACVARLGGGGTRARNLDVRAASFISRGRRLLCLTIRAASVTEHGALTSSERRRERIRLVFADALTGLPNRSYVRRRLAAILVRVAAMPDFLAILHLDLDRFGEINRTKGESTGDIVLRIVAKRLRSAVAAQDLVARVGDDEFVIVASRMPHLAAIEGFARRIQEIVQMPISLGGSDCKLSASIGIAVSPQDGSDAEALLRCADVARRAARVLGGRRHEIHRAELELLATENAQLRRSLEESLGSDLVKLAFQPVRELVSHRLVELDVELCWQHPRIGNVTSHAVTRVAEEYGIGAVLGHWLLFGALRCLRRWNKAGVAVVPVSLRLTSHLLEHGNFNAAMAAACRRFGVSPRLITLRIDEATLATSSARAIDVLRDLRAAGSRLIIGDFGRGYVSLPQLGRSNVDGVSLAADLVRNIDKGPAIAAAVSNAVEQARQCGLAVRAPAIDDRGRLNRLAALGCQFGQGSFFEQPLDPTKCAQALQFEATTNRRLPVSLAQ